MQVKGPAPQLEGDALQVEPGDAREDIIDEAISYFRLNILFKTFEIQTPADKVPACAGADLRANAWEKGM